MIIVTIPVWKDWEYYKLLEEMEKKGEAVVIGKSEIGEYLFEDVKEVLCKEIRDDKGKRREKGQDVERTEK